MTSNCCILCPLCGYRDCGTNICPNCGIIVENGIARRLTARAQECVKCGFHEEGTSIYCPVCNEDVMKEFIIKETKVARVCQHHHWEGFCFICNQNGTTYTATMDFETAREIPLCPFCKDPINTRPLGI